MADYRIFFLGPDEHITGVEIVECRSDLEAMAAAGVAGRPDGGVEVWQNARMVGRINVAGRPVSMHR
ncbi:hypothetical protein [Rhodopila sp.]|uniref:hypothetical protein n=1 Tax=Rhodopila sp. TaxID=2480087 RepID=UPI003D0AE300